MSYLTRRNFVIGAGSAVAGLAFYADEVERHILSTLRPTIRIKNLPTAFHGFKIAQLSDIHHRHYDEDWFLSHAVDAVNAEKPNMVCITGDFITANHQSMRENHIYTDICADILGGLECDLRYASFGNHDVIDMPYIDQALRRNRITVLRNTHLALDLKGDRMWLGGLADAYFDVPVLPAAVPKRKANEPMILMGHEPDVADNVSAYGGVDLMLAGHTHGGQIRLPFLPPFFLPALGEKYVHGLFQLGNLQLYVNRGIGSIHLPIRFHCPPEMTVLTLQPA